MLFDLKITGLLLTLLLVFAVYEFIRHHGLLILILRFLTGHLLHGRNPTHSGYFKRGVATDRVSPWVHLSHAERAGFRIFGGSAAMAIVWGWLYDRLVTEIVILATITALLAFAFRPAKVRQLSTSRQTIRPLAQALAPFLGTTPAVANSGLWVNKGYKKAAGGEAVATITMLDEFAAMPQQQSAIDTLMTSRLGIGITPTWRTDTRPMKVTYKAAYRPPPMVKWFDMLPEIRQCGQNEVLISITGDGSHKKWDMKAEEPHALVSANTRRGKTRLAMLITAQVLHKGGEAILIDPKQVGLDEFVAGHPKAKVYSDPQEVESDLWQPILDFKGILNERIKAFKADRTLTFKRQLLVIDELTIWSLISKQYWDNKRSSKDKATPPIFFDLFECLCAGAQFSMNVLVFGQVAGHSVLGNAIELFGFRMLAGYTRQSYMRLVGIPPIPHSQKGRGRFLIHDGDGSPEWSQVILGEIDEMRDYAMEPYRYMAGVPKRDIAAANVELTKMAKS